MVFKHRKGDDVDVDIDLDFHYYQHIILFKLLQAGNALNGVRQCHWPFELMHMEIG